MAQNILKVGPHGKVKGQIKVHNNILLIDKTTS